MAAVAELEGVTKSYSGRRALGPLTLTLPEGSVGLLGPNGAGKSTLLRLLLGLLPPDEGTLRVLGEEAGPGATALRRRIGYAPEGDARFPELTGIEAVAYAGRLVGMGKVDALQRAHQVIDYVELGEERYRLVEKYSTGMRQRLKLAQALVHDPELLVLDEPTEGVDPEARAAILELIADLEKEHGLKILVSSHLLHDVERLAGHVLVLHEGRAVAHGPLADLKAARTPAYTVQVHGPTEALEAKLTERGIAWAPAPPALRVELDDPREVLRLVEEAGLVVRRLTPVEMTLEEAFQRAIENAAKAPAEAPPPAPEAAPGGEGPA